MRGWCALALCVAVVTAGCGNEGKIEGDAGGSGGDSGSSGSAGSSGTGGSGGSAGEPIPATPCSDDAECDDGLHCNGLEQCEGRICRAGSAPNCDDGVACTVDRCIEDRQTCESTAPDSDNDGHRDALCFDSGGDALGDDCDDSDSTRYPGALEVCDADDHDEDCDLTTFGRIDFDGDGYLNANCCNTQDDGSLLCGDDCDDANARVHPLNTESCDGLDNDCNGLLDHPTEDQDGDGFATAACGGTDCDDFEAMTYAGAMERCDGFDNDCLQGGGEARDETDLDSDAYVMGVCMKMDETDLSPGDCDEDRRSANPMRAELCNGKDDDCDGAIDEGDMDCSSAVKQVGAGYLQTCAVRVNGTVACWGRNDNGRLGTGSDAWALDYPRSVIDPRHPSSYLSNVRTVSVGRTHACALHLDGRVTCWGTNYDGELGSGDTGDVQLATDVTGLGDVEEVCAGWGYTCARRSDGGVACWGDNWTGQLGDGTDEARAVAGPVLLSDPSVDIDCADNYACSVSSTGDVLCWGNNAAGQLGDVTTVTSTTPIRVLNVAGAKQVSTGREHACALLADETVWCWGDNSYGQRGTGQTGGSSLAAPLREFTGVVLEHIVEVRVGGGSVEWQDAADEMAHTCARLRDGRVMCVGSNQSAQLGYGDAPVGPMVPASASSSRYAVEEVEDAIQIASGHQHMCALTPAGQLMCWGDDNSGQLAGNGGWAHPAEQVGGL